jgi:flagellar M-ring protein FliF
MQFARMETATGSEAPKPLLGLDAGYWFKIIEAAILCVTALLIGLFVAKPLINRMFAAQAGAGGRGAVALGHASPVAGALPAPVAAYAPDGGAPALAAPGEGPAALVAAPRPGIDLSQLDGQFGENSIKKVGEVVSQHPEEALSIIRTWLHQPA